jgi:PAS domain S-box-containing protein
MNDRVGGPSENREELRELRQRLAVLETAQEELHRANARLLQRDAALHSLIGNFPIDFWARDRAGSCFLQSDHSVGIWGVLRDHPFDHPDVDETTLAQWAENNQQALRGEVIDSETTLVVKGGTQRDFHQIIAPIRDGESIVGVLGVNIDISERRRSRDLIQRERDLAVALSGVSDLTQAARICIDAAMRASGMEASGFYVVGEHGDVELVAAQGLSAAFVHQVRHFAGDSLRAQIIMKGEPIYATCEHLPPSIQDLCRQEELRAVAIVPIRHRGRTIACLSLSSRVMDETPVWARVVVESIAAQVGSAITRITAEEALRKSEQRFDLAVRGSEAAIWDWDIRTNRIWFSSRWNEMLGYEEGESLGTHLDWEQRLHPDDRTLVFAALNDALDGQTMRFDCEQRLRSKDGSYRWLLGRGIVVRDETDQPVRMVGWHLDVTERKEIQRQLEVLHGALAQRASQLQAMALEMTRSLERQRRHISQVLHDGVQQDLMAARIQLTLLCRRLVDRDLLHYADQIDGLLSQGIDKSRTLAVELSPPVLREAGLIAGLLWLAQRTEENFGLRVIVDAAPEANTDDEDIRSLLYQVARELLFNTVKYAHASHAEIRLTAVDGNQISLRVADDGVGFEPHRLKPSSQGGFGLFSIRECVAQLGGTLNIDTAPGGGTRTTLVISRRSACPVASARATSVEGTLESLVSPEPTAEDRDSPVRLGEITLASHSNQIRVMLADDHAIFRQGLAGLLREQAELLVVGEARDGHEAVALSLQTHPDVVLMDISMPGMNGIEATHRIKAQCPAIRVIGLSMHEESATADALRSAGADAYLTKDTVCDTLIHAIFAAMAR